MWMPEVHINLELEAAISRLIEKKQQIAAARPLPTIALEKLQESLAIEWTYNSNAIEGNTISLNETKLVLEQGITVRGKSLREHFEIYNHEKAIRYLYSLVNEPFPIRCIDMLKLHELVMQNIEDEFAGRIRNAGVRITGANFTPPNAAKVSDYLDELFSFINENPSELNVLLLATVFHHRFVWIHPFFDGNGRTVRLAMNLLFIRAGFPPAIILKNDRKKYYDALNAANTGNYEKLCLLMIQALERSLNIYLQALPEHTDEYKIIANLIEEEQLPYGQEYLSLLARQGKIDAYKEGRDWLTTKVAVTNYLSNRKRIRKNKPPSFEGGL